MILQSVISNLNTLLSATNYFEQLYCLAELITDTDDKTRPMIYSGSGNYNQVNNFDHYSGMGYWRKNGDVSAAIDNSESLKSCGNNLIIRHPLKFVCAVPRIKLPVDDQYSDDRLAEQIIKVLSGSNGLIKQAIGAKKVNILPQSYTTDNKDIIQAEYNGLWSDINYKFSYLSVQVEAEIHIDKNCITTPC